MNIFDRFINRSPKSEPVNSGKLALGNRADNYLANAILLEEATPPKYMKTTVRLVFYSFIIFVVWSIFSTLDVVTMAPGQVMPIQAIKIIQQVDGGRISEINVRDGQKVSDGEIVMRLNSTEAAAEYETIKAKYWGLYTKVERLRALVENRSPKFGVVPKEYAQSVSEQELTLKTSRAQIGQLENQIRILGEVNSIRGQLAREKLATKVQSLDAARNLSEAQAQLLQYKRSAMDDLNTSVTELAQTEEQMDKLRDRLERTEIISPIDGVVQDLKFRTIGGVIPAGATIMNIVPMDHKLQAELRVSPQDIGFIKVGQKVRVKIGTFDFMRYGTVDGQVEMISSFSSLDEKQLPYFKVVVSLPKVNVNNNAKLVIEPGMTLQADIVTNEQSVMEYMLRPIYVAFKQGMRER